MQSFTRVGATSLLFAGFVVLLQLAIVVTSAPAATATPEPAAPGSPQADPLGNFLSGVTALGVVLVHNNDMHPQLFDCISGDPIRVTSDEDPIRSVTCPLYIFYEKLNMSSKTSCGSYHAMLGAAQTLVKEVMIDGCEWMDKTGSNCTVDYISDLCTEPFSFGRFKTSLDVVRKLAYTYVNPGEPLNINHFDWLDAHRSIYPDEMAVLEE